MKSNDPTRFARELKGDFTEIDSHIRKQYLKMVLVALGIAACFILNWWLP